MQGAGQGRADADALNDLLIQHLASKLPQPEQQQHALAWACRLREDGRAASLRLLLDALLEAATSGRPMDRPFAAPVPSTGELPTLRDLAGNTRVPELLPPDMGWAREAVRTFGRRPPRGLFMGLQPKPRSGAACYMGVFGS